MANCRTCRVLVPWWRCPKQHAFMQSNEVMECHEPRETPLLVDELAEALGRLIARIQSGRLCMILGHDEAIKGARAALARYKEEGGDA